MLMLLIILSILLIIGYTALFLYWRLNKKMADIQTKKLAPRELAVLKLYAAGLADKEISRTLKISNHTTKSYGLSIRVKLGANNKAHAVAIGLRQGLIEPRVDF